jgi:NADH dehydrogenase
MADTGIDVVTGAFSYSGSSIARLLVAAGRSVRTLTGHPERQRADGVSAESQPFRFDDPVALAASMEGATTLYNTYWVRFPHGSTTHDTAIGNSRRLFSAAKQAGIQRIVHISITHASIDSPYRYFSGKAAVEQAVAEAGVSHAILRPAVLFGGRGVLLNNIAWLLRKLPVFAMAGKGDYRLRPIHVDDLATLCVRLGMQTDDVLVDAVGPESPTFEELVLSIRSAVGSRALLVHVPSELIMMSSRVLGRMLGDVLLTRDELHAMMQGLANTEGPPTGTTSLSSWITANKDDLGRRYLNELALHFRE